MVLLDAAKLLLDFVSDNFSWILFLFTSEFDDSNRSMAFNSA